MASAGRPRKAAACTVSVSLTSAPPQAVKSRVIATDRAKVPMGLIEGDEWSFHGRELYTNPNA